jgi:hypothetical protein
MNFQALNLEYGFMGNPNAQSAPCPVNTFCFPVLSENLPEDASYVWTLLEIDGKYILVNDQHYVNRAAYLISSKPWEDYVEIRLKPSEFSWNHL